MLASQEAADAQGLQVRARVKGHASHAQAPGLFTTAPVPAAQKLLAKLGWQTQDVDLWEVNEAFAVVPLAFMREMGISHDVVNVNGGACALGHPIGASGCPHYRHAFECAGKNAASNAESLQFVSVVAKVQPLRLSGTNRFGGTTTRICAVKVDYEVLGKNIAALVEGETDTVALMATIACEVHSSDARFDWTGFYRVVEPELMKIGPYQGGHGCLVIPFSRGVCGAAARTGQVQLVPDVEVFEGHIACASSTRSELVLPVWNGKRQLLGVFDLDSNLPDAFTPKDANALEQILKDSFLHAK